MTCRLPALVQVLGDIQLGGAALRHIGATHVDVGPAMLDIEALTVSVEDQMPYVDGPLLAR
jgi:hypothetical protein